MLDYPLTSFEKVSDLLAQRAHEMGANGFSLRDEYMTNEVAMDECGPMTWVLIIHADAMARLTGIAKNGALDMPITCVVNKDSPSKNQAIIQSAKLPLVVAMQLLDSALEHAVCVGMQDLGYSPEEWAELPDENKVIPIEPYFADLEANWITEELESPNPVDVIQSWPALFDRSTLSSIMANGAAQDSSQTLIRFPSAR